MDINRIAPYQIIQNLSEEVQAQRALILELLIEVKELRKAVDEHDDRTMDNTNI